MTNESSSIQSLEKAVDHAWQWFALHANQRMQAVNFFLIATTFLSAAYVAALRFPAVAVGVGFLGVLFSIFFYLFEVRIQELVKAGERALKPLQNRLAESSATHEMNICDFVETPKRHFSRYSIVIRGLCFSTVAAFALGSFFALSRLSSEDSFSEALTYRIALILSALGLCGLGYGLIATEKTTVKRLQYVAGAFLILAGGLILVVCSLTLLRTVRP